MNEQRLRTYCAQRAVAYVAPVRGETAEHRTARQQSLVVRLTPRQRRRIRRKGLGWA